MPVTEDKLSYEGEVYVRTVGRGIALEDEPGRPHLDEWIERWLFDYHGGQLSGGYSRHLRIRIDYLPPDADQAGRDSQ